jgi:hypothetical protein
MTKSNLKSAELSADQIVLSLSSILGVINM